MADGSNESGGTDYDKERLERGVSTHNVSLMSKLINKAHDELWKDEPKA